MPTATVEAGSEAIASQSVAGQAVAAFATEQQVVVLRVHESDYAVPIGRVQEIVRVPEITPLPEAPAGVEGLINLRGRVLPVIDLPSRLGLGNALRARTSRVVVVKGLEQRFELGLLVDGVSKVLRIGSADVEPPSELGNGAHPNLIQGVAKLGEQLVLMLDLDNTLAGYQSVTVPLT